MRKIAIWLSIIGLAAAAAYGAYWWYDIRLRPTTITEHQDEIAGLLEGAGWVSPGTGGAKLYAISHRDCPSCERFGSEELARLGKAGVETRLIAIALGDLNGQARSTPAERSTVAALWIDRSWELAERWLATPAADWTAPGLPPADGDAARTAVIGAGHAFVEKLTPLLDDNGIDVAYPLFIWWNEAGEMRACACDDPARLRFVREELGASSASGPGTRD